MPQSVEELVIKVALQDSAVAGMEAGAAVAAKYEANARAMGVAMAKAGQEAMAAGGIVNASATAFDKYATKYDDVARAANTLAQMERQLSAAHTAALSAIAAGNTDLEAYGRTMANLSARIAGQTEKLAGLRAAYASAAEGQALWSDGTAASIEAMASASAAQVELALSSAKAAGGTVAYGSALSNLRRELVPAAAAAQTYEGALGRVIAAERLGILSADEATAARTRATESFERAGGVMRQYATGSLAATEADRVAAQTRTAELSQAAYGARAGVGGTELVGVQRDPRQADLDAYSASLDQQRAKFDPVFAASKKYEGALDDINTAEKQGAISAAIAATARERETSAFSAANQPLAQMVTGLAGVGVAAEAAGGHLHNFGGGSSYATREMIVMAHEAMQGRFSRIPGSFIVLSERVTVLREGIARLATGFMSMATGPVGMIILAATAAGAVLSYLAVSAEDANLKLNRVGASLAGKRADYEAAAPEVVEVARQAFRGVGVSALDIQGAARAATETRNTRTPASASGAEVLQATTTLAGAQGLGGTQEDLQGLLNTSSQLAIAFGQKLPDAAKTLANAMGDPGAAAKKLVDDGLRTMNVGLAESIQSMADAGDKDEAFALVQKAIGDAMQGVTEKTTPLQDALKGLSNEFHAGEENGKSFSQEMGGALTSTLAVAVEGITKLIQAWDLYSAAVDHAIAAAARLHDIVLGAPTTAAPGAKNFPAAGGDYVDPAISAATQRAVTAGTGLGQVRPDILPAIQAAAASNRVDPELLARLQSAEGAFDPSTGTWKDSSTGRVGPMQISTATFAGMQRQPENFPGMAGVTDIHNPAQNVQAGASLLAHLLSKYNGDAKLAVLAYHDGETLVDSVIGTVASTGRPAAKGFSQEGLDEANKVTSGYTGRPELPGFADRGVRPPVEPSRYGDAVEAGRQISAVADAQSTVDDALTAAGVGGKGKGAGGGVGKDQATSQQAAFNTIEQIQKGLDAFPALPETQDTAHQFDVLTQALDRAKKAFQDSASPAENLTRELTGTTAQTDRLAKATLEGGAAVERAKAINASQKEAGKYFAEGTAGYDAFAQKAYPQELAKQQAGVDLGAAQKQHTDENQLALLKSQLGALNLNSDAYAVLTARIKATQAADDLGYQGKVRQGYIDSAVSVAKFNNELRNSTEARKADAEVARGTLDATNLAKDTVAGPQALLARRAQDASEKAAVAQHLVAGTPEYAAYTAAQVPAQTTLLKAQAAEPLAQTVHANDNQLQAIQAETAALGLNDQERVVYLGHIKAVQQAQATGLPIDSEEAKQFVATSDAVTAATVAFEAHKAAVQELQSVYSGVFNSITSSLTQAFDSGATHAVSFASIARGALNSVVGSFLQLGETSILSGLGLSTGGQAGLGAVLGAATGSAGSIFSGGGGGTGGSTLLGPSGAPQVDIQTAGGSTTSQGGSLFSFGNLSSLYSVASNSGVLGSVGITGQGGALSGIGQSLGLTGDGGAFTNVSNAVSGVLSTPLVSGAGSAIGDVTGAGAESASVSGALGDITGASAESAGLGTGAAGATIGTLASGVGLGAGVGMLEGSLFGPGTKTSQELGTAGALTGAAAGAIIGSIVPVIGTVIGGLIGGAIGGLGGVLGPGPKNPYSSIPVTTEGGQFVVGAATSQGEDTKAVNQVQAATAIEAGQLNTMLTENALVISSANKVQIGQNSPKGLQDPTKYGSLDAAFSNFTFAPDQATIDKFGAQWADALAAGLAGQTFATPAALGQRITAIGQYTNTTLPALQNFGQPTGSLAASDVQIKNAFAAAEQDAGSLGQDISQFPAMLDSAMAWAKAQVDHVTNLTKQTNVLGGQTAAATISGDPSQALAASLATFDANATEQTYQLGQQLQQVYGASYTSTQAYADQMTALEGNLSEQRLAIQQQYNLQAIQNTHAAADSLAQNQLTGRAATATLSGDPAQVLAAQLASFDQSASDQAFQLSTTLTNTFGQAYSTTQAYAIQMATLESSLGQQRLVIQQQYNDQLVSTADSTVSSLASYARGLSFGSQSPLTPTAQYRLAGSQFGTDAYNAQQGNFLAVQQLQSYASTFLTASQAVNGSGTRYVTDFNAVIAAVNQVATTPVTTLTAEVYTLQTQTQTQTLVANLQLINRTLAQILSAQTANVNMPSRMAA